MNPRNIIVAINAAGVPVRTMADAVIVARIHVAIECWLEDRNRFANDDTATRLAGFVVARSSGMVN